MFCIFVQIWWFLLERVMSYHVNKLGVNTGNRVNTGNDNTWRPKLASVKTKHKYPGDLKCQVINSHCVHYVEWVGPCFQWEEILSCTVPSTLCSLKKSMFNSLRSRRNTRHFTDDSFKCIFLNETMFISMNNSLNFIPKGQINNILALVQIMAWRRPGDKPLSEPMMII